METRWQIRKLLLKSFKALCYVDKNAIDQLLTSVLPMEMVSKCFNVTPYGFIWSFLGPGYAFKCH